MESFFDSMFKKKDSPSTPAKTASRLAPDELSPKQPQRPSAEATPNTSGRGGSGVSQGQVVQREMADLQEIMLDADKLRQLVEAGLEQGTLTDDTATLEKVAALSSRLLCRNRAREAAVRFGTALRVTQHKTSTLDAAASSMWPAYFRHSRENEEVCTAGPTSGCPGVRAWRQRHSCPDPTWPLRLRPARTCTSPSCTCTACRPAATAAAAAAGEGRPSASVCASAWRRATRRRCTTCRCR